MENQAFNMEPYELMSGDHFHVILHPDKEHGLIYNRLDGTVTTIYYNDAKELSNLKSSEKIHGIVGRFLDKYLVLIKGRSKVGTLYEPSTKTEHDIFVITQVQAIEVPHKSTSSATTKTIRNDSVKYNVNQPNDEELDIIKQLGNDDDFSSLPITINTNSYNTTQSRAANWNPFRLANSLKPMMPSQLLKSSVTTDTPSSSNAADTNDTPIGNSSSQNTSIQQDDADKRLVEEMIKLFNNTNSFYYSPTLDLTKRFSSKSMVKRQSSEAAWETADERFFWNKYMLKDLIDLSKEDGDANHFIDIILQGFISIEEYSTSPLVEHVEQGVSATSMNYLRPSSGNGIDSNIDENCDNNNSSNLYYKNAYRDRCYPKTYQLALVSRRSVFQAGTRYRRRGCDNDGNCANFVETEQIFRCNHHFTSMVIIRGSIPLFWFQTGYNYRPPPVLIRSDGENHKAFTRHFESLFSAYNTEQIISVDCTEQTGREKILHDAYRNHMERLSQLHPKLRLIEFDFHKHCRGRQCTDVQIEKHLQNCGLSEQLLKDVKYYWNDGDVVWRQEGIFRVNCLDCSDRTNVVQRAIALKILDFQLARLGIIEPDTCPDENECRKIMQQMWVANGNVLSTQYCGTRALFGGDRKLAGYLKDTYSSASRYYISKFRDVYRQAAIDAMLGVESVDCRDIKADNVKDQFELLSFDPMIVGRSGSALLKDVGNRFSNRLARLKGKFYVRPFGHGLGSDGMMHGRPDVALEATPEILETGLIDNLGEMTIDWPSSESLGGGGSNNGTRKHLQEEASSNPETQGHQDVFARFSNCDENFQDDDEFGQLMLSIDLAELQRLREEEEQEQEEQKQQQPQSQSVSKGAVAANPAKEEIGMTEACGVKVMKSSSESSDDHNQINTTST